MHAYCLPVLIGAGPENVQARSLVRIQLEGVRDRSFVQETQS